MLKIYGHNCCHIPLQRTRYMEEAIKRVNDWINQQQLNRLLDLSDLGLTTLPPIPSNCENLWCYRNKLTYLPPLPNCRILYCYDNLLTSLPDLPNCEILSCLCNLLTSLPELPKCMNLYCYNNNLTYFPTLPKCNFLYLEETYNNYKGDSIYNKIDYGYNQYLYIHNKLASGCFKNATPNYNKYAQIIQKQYKKYLRRQYNKILNSFLFVGLSKIISLYLIS